MKIALIKLLERVNITDACETVFDGMCSGIDCGDCPLYSQENRDKVVAELKGELK